MTTTPRHGPPRLPDGALSVPPTAQLCLNVLRTWSDLVLTCKESYT